MFTKDGVNEEDEVNEGEEDEKEKEMMLPMCRRVRG